MVNVSTCGNVSMKLWMFAFLAAVIISLIDTDRLLSPYAMFSAMVASNNVGSCETKPSLERSQRMFKVASGMLSNVYE